ncbi:MAG: hypothetical protein ACT4RN_02860 [Pseudonocardia sp.]
MSAPESPGPPSPGPPSPEPQGRTSQSRTSQSRTSQSRSPEGVVSGIDLIALVKGAAIAFCVLVVGGLATPLVVRALPLAAEQVPAAYAWGSAAVAIGAFVLAGSRIGEATRPVLHGGAAALGAYLLYLPLTLIVGTAQPVTTVLLAALVAVLIGALTGLVSGRRRGPVHA